VNLLKTHDEGVMPPKLITALVTNVKRTPMSIQKHTEFKLYISLHTRRDSAVPGYSISRGTVQERGVGRTV